MGHSPEDIARTVNRNESGIRTVIYAWLKLFLEGPDAAIEYDCGQNFIEKSKTMLAKKLRAVL